MACVGKAFVVFNDTEAVGLLHHHAGNSAAFKTRAHVVGVGNAVFLSYHLNLYAVETGVSVDDGEHLRIDGRRYKHLLRRRKPSSPPRP